MKNDDKPIANPLVVLREEFDDWAILFDPDTGHGFGLCPTGVYLWKLLDGEHTVDALVGKLHEHAEGVPEEASDHIGAFVDELVAEGLAGFDITGRGPEKRSYTPLGESSEVNKFNDEPPLKREGLTPTLTQRRFNVDQGPQPTEKKITYEKPELVDFQADRRALGGPSAPCQARQSRQRSVLTGRYTIRQLQHRHRTAVEPMQRRQCEFGWCMFQRRHTGGLVFHRRPCMELSAEKNSIPGSRSYLDPPTKVESRGESSV